MSEQPPWPGQPGQFPNPPAGSGVPQQPHGQPQNPYAQPQQPYGQDPQNPYPQAPYFQPPAPRKKSALPWILGGAGVVVLGGMVVVAVVVVGMLRGGSTAGTAGSMVDAPTTSATLLYPDGWIQNGQNVTVIKDDGSSPAERFSAINQGKDATALMVYEAGERPDGVVTTEKIHAAIEQGLDGQLAASQDELVLYRSDSGFGCLSDFAYTSDPAIVERDGLYGYGYGYSCMSMQGGITGEYLVAYDTNGVSHRLTVEAQDAEWARSSATLETIVDSLKPVL